MRLKTTKLNILDGLELKDATFQNKSFPTHFHDTYSIGIIKEGIESLTINNQNFIVPSKSVVIINQFEAHSNHQYDNDRWAYQSIYMSIDTLHYFNRINSLTTKFNYNFQNLINDNILYNMLSDFHLNQHENKEYLINIIISYLLKNFIQQEGGKKNKYDQYRDLIEEVKYFFSVKYFEKINIETLATKRKLNRYQFIRAFKAHTGLTPIAYITLLRLNQSKMLLIKNIPLVEIALDCGFYDQSHFTNYFKKYFGISPVDYKINYCLLKL